MKPIKAFSRVRLVQPVIEGIIIGGKLSDDGKTIDYEVEYQAPHNGETRTRHFNSEELALVGDEPTDAEVDALRREYAGRKIEQHQQDVLIGEAHDKEAAK